MTTTWWCPTAWLPDGPTDSVRITVAGGRIAAVERAVAAQAGDDRLTGLVLPGFADAHSHAFHRALRGRTHGPGDFWAWREQMYRVAGALDPDSYLDLARAVYAEMALAGVTAVGEFHYLHRPAPGRRYDDPNAMAEALRAAAADAGVRLTLLDTCYLTGGIGRPLEGVARLFSDDDAGAWAERVERLRPGPGFLVGAAVHSVRAVPRVAIAAVAAWARDRGVPLHAHLSEQVAENDESLAAYGLSPTQVLAEAGFLTPGATVVHGVHVSEADRRLLGAARTTTCVCPTTERDLADGIAPARALLSAGSPLCLGSDQHATVDLLAEAQALEMHERLVSGRRGVFTPVELVEALTSAGHRAIGRPDGGVLAVGAPADLVAVRTDTVRTAGCDPAQLVLVAGAGDVDTVVVGGDVVVRHGHHRVGDVAALLGDAVRRVLEQAGR